MYKQIFDKSNSYPELIESVFDDETGEEYFDYDKEKYTDVMPPSHLYTPLYYDDKKQEWIGSSMEEHEKYTEKLYKELMDSIQI